MKQSTRNVWLQVISGGMIVTLLVWHGLQRGPVELDSGYHQTMGTFARILVVAPDKITAEQSVESALEVFRRVEARMSDYDPASQISEVNRRAFYEPVAVDPDVFEVISAAVRVSDLTDGAFDITVGPVVQLWRNARMTGVAPTGEQIAEARTKVGWKHLILDPQKATVRFAVEGMALDLGGIAKGYAIDRAVDAMRLAGAAGGMVDIGGDLTCFGQPIGGKPSWYIGLQDPADDGRLLLRLKLDDRAVATSGDYRRFALIDGQKHSHIVNPATADAAAGLSSVTVIAATAIQADALATALSVLGHPKGMELIKSLPDVEAIFIPSIQPESYLFTPGAAYYIEHP